jgi:undecaprenyl diphosphate synthase
MHEQSMMPKHVAFIMDGNGRWAKAHGLPRSAGHKQGIESVERVIAFSRERGISVVSLYAFSTENWQRPKPEIDFLFAAFNEYLLKKKDDLLKKDIRLVVTGRREGIPAGLAATIDAVTAHTASCAAMTLNIAFNYGGRGELVDACRAIARKVAAGTISPDAIDASCVAAHLYQPDLPDVDLLVRTSGEERISNFMLWQCSYAEFYVTDKHWPAFGDLEYQDALDTYAARCRRFGAV